MNGLAMCVVVHHTNNFHRTKNNNSVLKHNKRGQYVCMPMHSCSFRNVEEESVVGCSFLILSLANPHLKAKHEISAL